MEERVKKLCKIGMILLIIIGVFCFFSFGAAYAQTKTGGDIKPKAKTGKSSAPAKSPSTTAAAASKAGGKATCLACHGPFEKIIEKTVDYKMMSGEQEIKSNPHRYVPHDSRDVQDIPECSYCHEPHPVPLTKKEGLPKPTATWCYGCHHAKVLTCGTCH
jgi:predicted CXXCH cytochrome family protein